MTIISLRAYNREIEELIEHGQIGEATSHCKQILKTYPKHVDTYRLLGKAFLEEKKYGDAADILQRVLSAIPDDFVSHLGMSIIREDEGNLDSSIWHMERAFEVQPSNNAIQEELRRLYGRRDGLEPAKIRLTRGALARMYTQGELYQQAIAELRAALTEDPMRPDLQVLLARMFFLAGQRVEAAETCTHVLNRLPFCLEANQILATILQDTERAAESEEYWQRVCILDPYASHVSPKDYSSTTPSDAAVTLQRLDWEPTYDMQASEAQPGWAASLGVDIGDSAVPETPVPRWLTSPEGSDLAPLESVSPEVIDADQESAPEKPIEPASEDVISLDEGPLPEWLAEEEKQQPPAPIPSPSDDQKPVQSDNPPEAPNPAFADNLEESSTGESPLPEWLNESPEEPASQDVPQLETPSEEIPSEIPPQDGTPQMEEQTPQWLSDANESTFENDEDADKPDTLDLPSLEKMQAAAEQQGSTATETPDEADEAPVELPGWLQEAGWSPREGDDQQYTELPTTPVFSTTDGVDVDSLTPADIPEWLRDLAPPEVSDDISPELQKELETDTFEDDLETPEPKLQTGEATPWLDSHEPGATDSIVSWLRKKKPDEPKEEELPEMVEPEESAPSWLKDAFTASEDQEEDQPAAEPILEEAAAPIAVPPIQEEIISDTPPPAPDVQPPVSEVEMAPPVEQIPEPETPSEAPPFPEDEPSDALPEWLLELDDEELEVEKAEPVVEETPEQWLEGVPDEDALADTLDEPFSEEEPIPEWLRIPQEEPEAEPAVADLQPEQVPEEPPVLPEAEAVQPVAEADLPDDEVTESIAEAELPDWLQEAGEEPAVEPVSPPIVEPDEPIVAWEQIPDDEVVSEPSEIVEEMVEVPSTPDGILNDEPDWLKALVDEPSDIETPPLDVPETEARPEIAEPVDQSDAFAWLEGLAAEQGAPEDELVTPPEERSLEPPDWIKAEESWDQKPAERIDPRETLEQPESPAMPIPDEPVEERPTPEEETPEWLAGLEEIPEEPADELTTADFGQQEVVSQLAADLPDWLSDGPVETDEVETPVVAEPTPAPQQMEDLDLPEWLQTPEGEPAAEPSELEAEPGIPTPTPEIVDEVPVVTPPATPPVPADEMPVPKPSEPVQEISKVPSEDADEFAEAKSILATGDVGKAVEHLAKIIKRGQMLEEIIAELQEALYNYPVDFELWQTLGDAYLRANRLQEALDTYTKAEELLR